MPGSLPSSSRLLRRIRGERWLVDMARQTPAAHAARRAIERARVERRIRRAGGVDAALDQIVTEAIARGSDEDGR